MKPYVGAWNTLFILEQMTLSMGSHRSKVVKKVQSTSRRNSDDDGGDDDDYNDEFDTGDSVGKALGLIKQVDTLTFYYYFHCRNSHSILDQKITSSMGIFQKVLWRNWCASPWITPMGPYTLGISFWVLGSVTHTPACKQTAYLQISGHNSNNQFQAINWFILLADDSAEVPTLRGKSYGDFQLFSTDWEKLQLMHEVLQVNFYV